MKAFSPLSTTSIGSVPFLDPEWTLDLIADTCPDIPTWPQMVNRHPREDMVLQAVDGLPLLDVDDQDRRVQVRSEAREEALTEFYEHFIGADYEYFAVPPIAEVGLTAMIRRAGENPGFGPDFLKGQVIGPASFGLSVRTPDDKLILDDPELGDTVVKGLGAKAAWVAQKIREAGRSPLIFLDEPGLTGFGSAFSTLQRDQVVDMLNEAADIVRSAGEARVGIHICGNTDWGMVTSTNLDVINFDAYGYLDHFLLYPDQIKAFLERGGYIAWGIVPTRDFTGAQTAEELASMMRNGWKKLSEKGLDHNLVVERSLITPSCGMGTMDRDLAQKAYELLPRVADLLRG